MKTKSQFITELKSEYPIIQVGSDQVGYTELTPAEYEAQITESCIVDLKKNFKKFTSSFYF